MLGLNPPLPFVSWCLEPWGETVFSSFSSNPRFCSASSPLWDQALQSCFNNGPSYHHTEEAKLTMIQLEDAVIDRQELCLNHEIKKFLLCVVFIGVEGLRYLCWLYSQQCHLFLIQFGRVCEVVFFSGAPRSVSTVAFSRKQSSWCVNTSSVYVCICISAGRKRILLIVMNVCCSLIITWLHQLHVLCLYIADCYLIFVSSYFKSGVSNIWPSGHSRSGKNSNPGGWTALENMKDGINKGL